MACFRGKVDLHKTYFGLTELWIIDRYDVLQVGLHQWLKISEWLSFGQQAFDFVL